MILRLVTTDGQTIVMDGGRIVADKGTAPVTVEIGAGTLHAGLINAHDHLHRNHYPRLGSPPYADAYEWGADIHAQHARTIARARAVPRMDALLFGALKNLIGGATTVVHHDAYESAFANGFPVRVPRVQHMHSPGLTTGADVDTGQPFCIHVAEGTNLRAAREVDDLARRGLLCDKLIAVHAIAVDNVSIAALASARAAVVWCPTSNEFLFGCTPPLELFESGVDAMIGSDSMLTGAGTLVDELRAARTYGYLDENALVAAVTTTAARRLRLPEPSLAPGSAADVILLRAPLLDATVDDVALVLVDGVPRVADPELHRIFDLCGVQTDMLRVRGRERLVDARLAAAAQRVMCTMPEAARLFD
jgi:hypothetical protein